MIKSVKSQRLALLLILFFSSAHAACVVTDDKNKMITLAQPAQRIISLAPDITETLFAIGAGDYVVGVMQGSDYPVNAKKIPIVGSYAGIDLEKIVSLHPDLIVVWGNSFARSLSALKKFNIPVYVSEPRQLNDVAHTMQQLGCLTDRKNSATSAAQKYTARLQELGKTFSKRKSVKVFFQMGSYSLITINKDSWINQAITLCGGVNVFKDAKLIAPEVSWESVVVANPGVIINDTATSDWKKRWMKWSAITAVSHQTIFSMNPDIIERASPRLIDGVQAICEFIDRAR